MIWLILGLTAYTDLRYRLIPNAVIIASALYAVLAADPSTWIGGGIGGALISMPLYHIGWIAGGDVKYTIVLTMILGIQGIYITSIALLSARLMAGWMGRGQPYAVYVLGAYGGSMLC